MPGAPTKIKVKRYIEPALPLVFPRKRTRAVMTPKPTGTLVPVKTRAEIRAALMTGESSFVFSSLLFLNGLEFWD
jgi:hypothetical protein